MMSFKSYIHLPTEAQVMRVSVWATAGIAVFGIVLGIASSSQAILFDGLFALIDASMSFLSLCVVQLLAREGSRRFQYGFWHFEPLVAAFNGAVLLLLCLYAIFNAIRSLLTGGSEPVSLDVAGVYAVFVCVMCMALWCYERRANRRLDSELIRIDMKAFLMSTCISAGLFVGFAASALVERLGYAAFRPYADSLVLLCLALGLLPMPVAIVYRAMREVFLIAPVEMHDRVRRVVASAVERHNLMDFRSYVAKTGRMYLVEIHILVDPQLRAEMAVYDRIRQEIGQALGGEARLDEWLSISFTARAEWM